MSGSAFEPVVAREPTREQAREAVALLTDELLVALAKGPTEDPDECNACNVFDPWLWGPDGGLYDPETGEHTHFKDDPLAGPVALLSDYHDFYADHGRGDEAYARCIYIYQAARDELAARAVAR